MKPLVSRKESTRYSVFFCIADDRDDEKFEIEIRNYLRVVE